MERRSFKELTWKSAHGTFGASSNTIGSTMGTVSRSTCLSMIAALPQRCLRSDRRSSFDQWGLTFDEALAHETELGLATIRSGETQAGAAREKADTVRD